MNNKPTRTLHKHFTATTLHRAKRAKRRLDRRSLPVFKTSFGIAVAAAAVLVGGVGTYAAANNWFNGTVGVNQNGSVITLDLNGCDLPPGVHDPNTRAVKFKMLGEQHVSQQDLQRAMTIECEFNAVTNFFLAQPVSANLWASTPVTILAIEGNNITFRYLTFGQRTPTTRTIPVNNAQAFENRSPIALSSLKVGDHALLGITTTAHLPDPETDDILGGPLKDSRLTILKTQYDIAEAPSASKKNIYAEWNIMPLDWFEQIKHKN